MAEIKLKGNPIHTIGDLPKVGSDAPAFTLVKADLSEVSLTDLAGKRVVLNIFPSIDTGTCALSVKRFNKEAAGLQNTVVLCVSADLPFAGGRFCGAEGIDKVDTASVFRAPFGKDYGVEIIDGPLTGLMSRSVVVIDERGKVIYNQQVPEIADEPDYAPVLESLK